MEAPLSTTEKPRNGNAWLDGMPSPLKVLAQFGPLGVLVVLFAFSYFDARTFLRETVMVFRDELRLQREHDDRRHQSTQDSFTRTVERFEDLVRAVKGQGRI